jgi:fructosamine-3-kinase
MMEGEYNSMKEIHQYLPMFAPKPIAWGKFKQTPMPTYFFLAEFVDMSTGAPDPATFALRLSQLHGKSKSPTGKFGFHVTTCHGPNWQDTRWHHSWCFYYTRLLTQFFEREIQHNGHNDEYEREFQVLKSKTIPRVLEPLQSDGRMLEPCLVHGDLWEENCGTKIDTGEPVVFDAAAMYAHSEFELGMWRRDVVRFGKTHMRHYHKLVAPSEPRGQWDDRNRLYSIKFDLGHSIAHPETAESQRHL